MMSIISSRSGVKLEWGLGTIGIRTLNTKTVGVVSMAENSRMGSVWKKKNQCACTRLSSHSSPKSVAQGLLQREDEGIRVKTVITSQPVSIGV